MNNKGQSVLSEHVMVFFVVVAAIVAMTTYIQRGFEARIHDARDYVINSVNSVCDVNCQQAAGGQITTEYKPYYTVSSTFSLHNEQETNGATTGNAQVIGAIYYHNKNEEDQAFTVSDQLPPLCSGAANGNCQLATSGSGN